MKEKKVSSLLYCLYPVMTIPLLWCKAIRTLNNHIYIYINTTCYKYTLLDVLTHVTVRYFASCIVFRGYQKYEQRVKRSVRILSNHRMIYSIIYANIMSRSSISASSTGVPSSRLEKAKN